MPSQVVSIAGDIKTIVEHTTNENGQKVKITRRIRLVNPNVLQRRSIPKFGDCKSFGPGPDQNATSIGDDVFLKLTMNSKDLDGPDEAEIQKQASIANSKIVCRICKGDHWTTKCPFKNTHVPVNEIAAKAKETPAETGKYVPPSRRGGNTANTTSDGKRDDSLSVRISNLSSDATEQDLRVLLANFGPFARVFVAKDQQTGLCKGFAFVTFYDRERAQACIDKLDGHGYDSLILKVDWAKRT